MPTIPIPDKDITREKVTDQSLVKIDVNIFNKIVINLMINKLSLF